MTNITQRDSNFNKSIPTYFWLSAMIAVALTVGYLTVAASYSLWPYVDDLNEGFAPVEINTGK